MEIRERQVLEGEMEKGSFDALQRENEDKDDSLTLIFFMYVLFPFIYSLHLLPSFIHYFEKFLAIHSYIKQVKHYDL